jgi:hypothetical protein
LRLIKISKQNYEADIKSKLSNIKNNVLFWSTLNAVKPKIYQESVISVSIWQEYLESLHCSEQVSVDRLVVSSTILDENLDRNIEIEEILRVIYKFKNSLKNLMHGQRYKIY